MEADRRRIVMSEHDAERTAEEERERREHEAEARRRDPDERREDGEDSAEGAGPPGNIQPGTNTGS
jgi:hypothetical protein